MQHYLSTIGHDQDKKTLIRLVEAYGELFNITKKEMHAVDVLIDVPMSAPPVPVGELVFDGVEPILSGFVYSALVDT